MVDIFFKLIDQIIELLKLKQQKREQVFKEIIEPLFTEMTVVVQDYFALFREAEEYCEPYAPVTELREATQKLRERRDEFLHARIQIREMAGWIQKELDDEQVTDFALKIGKFFYHIPHVKPPGTPWSDSLWLIEFFALIEDSELNPKQLGDAIRQVRSNLEHSWVEITGAYALLRIKYLGPQRLVGRKTIRPMDQE